LREGIALEVRVPFDLTKPSLPPEFAAHRRQESDLRINRHNPAYLLVVATLLDALEAARGSYAKAASSLGLTTSQLLRFLRSDPHVWRAAGTINSNRLAKPTEAVNPDD
jgi:hypothetical protein